MAAADRHDKPTYSLQAIQDLVRNRQYTLTARAERDARHLGLLYAVPDCICALDERCIADGGHFFKSSEARNPPTTARGLWHDVYKITYEDVPLYVKVQLALNGTAAVISFHENSDCEHNA